MVSLIESIAMAETAKKGKKAGAPEPPRFGRVKANLKMGIVGLPNVGKNKQSKVLHLLTQFRQGNHPYSIYSQNKQLLQKIIHFVLLIRMKVDAPFLIRDTNGFASFGSQPRVSQPISSSLISLASFVVHTLEQV